MADTFELEAEKAIKGLKFKTMVEKNRGKNPQTGTTDDKTFNASNIKKDKTLKASNQPITEMDNSGDSSAPVAGGSSGGTSTVPSPMHMQGPTEANDDADKPGKAFRESLEQIAVRAADMFDKLKEDSEIPPHAVDKIAQCHQSLDEVFEELAFEKDHPEEEEDDANTDDAGKKKDPDAESGTAAPPYGKKTAIDPDGSGDDDRPGSKNNPDAAEDKKDGIVGKDPKKKPKSKSKSGGEDKPVNENALQESVANPGSNAYKGYKDVREDESEELQKYGKKLYKGDVIKDHQGEKHTVMDHHDCVVNTYTCGKHFHPSKVTLVKRGTGYKRIHAAVSEEALAESFELEDKSKGWSNTNKRILKLRASPGSDYFTGHNEKHTGMVAALHRSRGVHKDDVAEFKRHAGQNGYVVHIAEEAEIPSPKPEISPKTKPAPGRTTGIPSLKPPAANSNANMVGS